MQPRKNLIRLMNVGWTGVPRRLELPKVSTLNNKLKKAAKAQGPVGHRASSPPKRSSPPREAPALSNDEFKKALAQYARMEAAIKSRPPVTASVRKLVSTVGGGERARQAFAKIDQVLPGFSKMALRRRRLPGIEEETMYNMALARRKNMKSGAPRRRSPVRRTRRLFSKMSPIMESPRRSPVKRSPSRSPRRSPMKRSPVKSHPGRNVSPKKKRSLFGRAMKAVTIALAASSMKGSTSPQGSTALVPIGGVRSHKVPGYGRNTTRNVMNATRVMSRNEQQARNRFHRMHGNGAEYAYALKHQKYGSVFSKK